MLLQVGRVNVPIRRSARARRIALRVRPDGGGVELVLPRSATVAEGRRFAEDNAGWVRRRTATLPPRVTFRDGGMLPVYGHVYWICHVPDSDDGVRQDGDRLIVGGDTDALTAHVTRWLRARALFEIERLAHAKASIVHRTVTGVSLRDTCSRWGSCATNGKLSFSWRLVMAPKRVLDYVVAHEVAHLVWHDHGPRFWALVDKLTPDVDDSREWLNQYGAGLLRYG